MSLYKIAWDLQTRTWARNDVRGTNQQILDAQLAYERAYELAKQAFASTDPHETVSLYQRAASQLDHIHQELVTGPRLFQYFLSDFIDESDVRETISQVPLPQELEQAVLHGMGWRTDAVYIMPIPSLHVVREPHVSAQHRIGDAIRCVEKTAELFKA